jgi:hypothetical protein
MVIIMTDVATWVTGGLAGLAAAASAYFAWRADRSQRTAVNAQQEATAAAKAAAESADKAQRTQVRPALSLEWDQRREFPAINAPILLSHTIRNVGHGTALIESIGLFERGNLRLEFHDTRDLEQKLAEQFDVEIFQRLEGVLMRSIPVELYIPPLTDIDRALEVGATRTLFKLKIPDEHAPRIASKFREHSSARILYRSLTGDEFSTAQQFADVRNAGHRHPATPATVPTRKVTS